MRRSRAGGEFPQLLRGQFRDVTDALTGAGEIAQEGKAFDLLIGILAPVGGGARGLNRAVALFPDANDVGAQPGPLHNRVD